MATLVVERRATTDAEEIFRLYAEVFGVPQSAASQRRWRWQYLENPQTPPEGPEIWVAREGEQVLGQYASMPVRLWWGGREVKSSWGMDVFLRQQARGKGIGALLFTTWSDHVEVALGLGLTESSYGLFKKLRYEDVGPVPFFQKVLDARAVARRRLGPVLGALAAPGLAVGLALWQRRTAGADESVRVSAVSQFGGEYDGLWERARSSYAMCVRRDAAYLRWKYTQCPERQYDLWEAHRDDILTGYAVSRHEDYHGLRLGWVIDVFADAADMATKRALIDAILRQFTQVGVARAQAFSMNAALAGDLRAAGFRAGVSPMQFCVRARVPSAEVLADRGRWQVVFGDSDMDR